MHLCSVYGRVPAGETEAERCELMYHVLIVGLVARRVKVVQFGEIIKSRAADTLLVVGPLAPAKPRPIVTFVKLPESGTFLADVTNKASCNLCCHAEVPHQPVDDKAGLIVKGLGERRLLVLMCRAEVGSRSSDASTMICSRRKLYWLARCDRSTASIGQQNR